MKTIYNTVMNLLEKETTKISKKALDILDREEIANIVEYNNKFWFESYSFGNNCPNYIYKYLINIKNKND